jgi:hypothetical protein
MVVAAPIKVELPIRGTYCNISTSFLRNSCIHVVVVHQNIVNPSLHKTKSTICQRLESMSTTIPDKPIWASLWGVNDNGESLKDLTNKVFFGKWESLHIANAVENKMCVGDKTMFSKDAKVCFHQITG